MLMKAGTPSKEEELEEELSAKELQFKLHANYQKLLKQNEINLKKVFVNRIFDSLNLTKYKVK